MRAAHQKAFLDLSKLNSAKPNVLKTFES